eukprot:COSAG02_NODE_51079_length_316_cov_0.953917_1_plen_21_part_01
MMTADTSYEFTHDLLLENRKI